MYMIPERDRKAGISYEVLLQTRILSWLSPLSVNELRFIESGMRAKFQEMSHGIKRTEKSVSASYDHRNTFMFSTAF